MLSTIASSAMELLRRADDESDPDDQDSGEQEIVASWAYFISIMLLIAAFFTSYMLQQKKVQAVHETVISIFAGMTVGLILRVSGGSVRTLVSFSYQIFFNILLPPIILNSGYELHQANFFRNIGSILTFAFAGTFLSAVVIGLLLWLYTRIPLEGLDMSFVDAISVGATLSATDPVTILAIFNTYKVDPKLYTVIFGESILNDAIAIVIFETAQKYKDESAGTYGFSAFLGGIGLFLLNFFGSLFVGCLVGVGTALVLKLTYVRRTPQIETCLIVLISYACYFFSQGVHFLSGIVSLLFCGITLKHYAYFNMSRRTQLSTKYFFQIIAQLSENFIFIYLGLSLFTDDTLRFQPLLIIVTVVAVCAARWVAVFPLSKAINWFHHYRARRQGKEINDELPYNYQAMLFWAGLRGAVGVALAALLQDDNSNALKATVLVVVVLTVIIFGGTTARMLEILNIKTGVVEEVDSDDEFDIEAAPGGSYYKRSGTGIGYNPRARNGSVRMDRVNSGLGRRNTGPERGSYVSGSRSPSFPTSRPQSLSRKGSRLASGDDIERVDLLGRSGTLTDSDLGSDIDTSDLPPPARRSPRRKSSPILTPGGTSEEEGGLNYPTSGHKDTAPISTRAAIRQLFTTQDPQALFRQFDEDFIKPKLLLDGGHPGPIGSKDDEDGAGPS
ncbi:Sodium/hydrogen exchanger family-domain-containing protein [Xylariomycetidae sp. FL2044]|nr:Sodium/hydrogen exchanger family-domain-containing protein [Xylariomycetidae sp. FL2044]